MADTGRPTIKVCGITSQSDADMCRELGAELLGFIFHPKSPRSVTQDQAACIRTEKVLRVGVFVDQSADEVAGIMDRAGLDLAQLHGGQDEGFCRTVGPERVIKVFWPMRCQDPETLRAETDRYKNNCRYFLLDAGSSGGGHGKSIDFRLLENPSLDRPWFLAGGLGPDTVNDALTICRPDFIDLNSGVESSAGKKDRKKIETVVELVKKLRRET